MLKQMKSLERWLRPLFSPFSSASRFSFHSPSAIFTEDDTDGRTQRAFPVQCCCVLPSSGSVSVSTHSLDVHSARSPYTTAVDKLQLKRRLEVKTTHLTAARSFYYTRTNAIEKLLCGVCVCMCACIECVCVPIRLVPVWEKNTHIRRRLFRQFAASFNFSNKQQPWVSYFVECFLFFFLYPRNKETSPTLKRNDDEYSQKKHQETRKKREAKVEEDGGQKRKSEPNQNRSVSYLLPPPTPFYFFSFTNSCIINNLLSIDYQF